MKVELFPFQKRAVSDLRMKTAIALNTYRTFKIPQVISLQAPTGSGKTIIMAALVEDIYYGTEQFAEQPEAIFVWLSDSPALNEQTRQKFDLKADKIRFEQCVTIEDESFDMEMLEDGHIYFLNTQKLSKAANLVHHSDTRQYTIWETLSNTVKEKADRLYFIIDEAHRGMQGKEAGKATSIMQRFLKGYECVENGVKQTMPPMPVVIGVSATADRFNKLVAGTTSTLNRCEVSPAEVRASGLLKDRIVITYPDDPEKNNELAVLQAATDEWQMKCNHWYQYSYEQHYAQVNPVFVIQVSPGTGSTVSSTNLDDVIAKIEERIGYKFKEHEVVHTFGSTGTLSINGLTVHHIEPPEIADDKRIRVVLFKENLSTGWDCPRAETMMSFRHANDATYIAQLLGRMVRTPLQCHILVDDYLNDVRLFLPYFNQNTVKEVVEELQKTEGGDIPTVIDGESLENPTYIPWTVHPTRQKIKTPLEGQTDFFTQLSQAEVQTQVPGNTDNTQPESTIPVQPVQPQQVPTALHQPKPVQQPDAPQEAYQQAEFPTVNIDRAGITKFINEQGYLTYLVRSVRIHGYLKSLLSLASLLTQANIYPKASDEVADEVVDMIRAYVEKLMKTGEYDTLAAKVLSFKLSVRIFDVFGEAIDNGVIRDMFTATDSDLDRQLRAADATLGGAGIHNRYGKKYFDEDDPSAFKIDCILFAADEDCMKKLYRYAEDKFHDLDDQYRKYVVMKSDKCKKMYSDIIANGDVVSKHNFSLPETISVRVEADGKKYDNHLFADDEGIATIKLNSWEEAVIEEEGKQKDFVCWLRNPSRGTWALRLPYEMHGETKAMYPDFIIVRYDPILNYVIDILEPHSFDFADNLGKAKGLARYAEAEPRIGRVQLIHPSKDPAEKTRLKRLDLSKGSVRNKVLQATTNDDLAKIFDTDGFFS